jgi:hypothetical protein
MQHHPTTLRLFSSLRWRLLMLYDFVVHNTHQAPLHCARCSRASSVTFKYVDSNCHIIITSSFFPHSLIHRTLPQSWMPHSVGCCHQKEVSMTCSDTAHSPSSTHLPSHCTPPVSVDSARHAAQLSNTPTHAIADAFTCCPFALEFFHIED